MISKIIAIVGGIVIGSIWLVIIIASGVSLGLKTYFDKDSEKK